MNAVIAHLYGGSNHDKKVQLNRITPYIVTAAVKTFHFGTSIAQIQVVEYYKILDSECQDLSGDPRSIAYEFTGIETYESFKDRMDSDGPTQIG